MIATNCCIIIVGLKVIAKDLLQATTPGVTSSISGDLTSVLKFKKCSFDAKTLTIEVIRTTNTPKRSLLKIILKTILQ